mmetsp:Transcript_25377/g.78269  ORF Transcript_25377/g.78269 Transcript_25377/m.78269 type:complete len:267 (+) Transcript_25377:474-1274(+)
MVLWKVITGAAAVAALLPTAARAPRRCVARASEPGSAEVSEADVQDWMRNMDVADLLSEDGEAKSVKDIEKALLDAEEVPVRDEPKVAAVDKAAYDESPYVGDFDGTDDELEAPWRTEAAGIASTAVESTGAKIQDIFWEPGVLKVTVVAADGSTPDAEVCAAASRAAVAALETREDLRVLERHSLEVTSPGATDVLTEHKQFEAFKGFDVIVKTLNPIDGGEERTMEGKLVERTIDQVKINLKGRIVKIPWHLVGEVRLPPAKEE